MVEHVNQERFVLVRRDAPDRAAASALAERAAMGVAHPSAGRRHRRGDRQHRRRAPGRRRMERPESVLRRAIKAGNRARVRGGSRIEIAADAPNAVIIDAEFAAALTNDEFVVHYLPIVSCSSGRIAGFESLVRWDHPDRGLLMPSEFLPQAERNGAIVAVGARAIEIACRQVAEWHERSATTLKLNVNLSMRELADPALPTRLARVIATAGLAPGSVWIEVSEETVLADRDAAGEALQRLRDVGVRPGDRRLRWRRLVVGVAEAVPARRDQDRRRAHRPASGAARTATRCAVRSWSSPIRWAWARDRGRGRDVIEQWQALRRLEAVSSPRAGWEFGPARPAADYGHDHPAGTLGLLALDNRARTPRRASPERTGRAPSSRSPPVRCPAMACRTRALGRVAVLVLVLTVVGPGVESAAGAATGAANMRRGG